MSPKGILGVGLSVILSGTASAAEGPGAPGRRPPAQAVAAAPGSPGKPRNAPAHSGAPDFKVVFWFTRNELKHQVYDVRKGQYTQAVDDWVHYVEHDASGFLIPGRMATVRNVYLRDLPGETEAEKLKAAIAQQELRILGTGTESVPLRTRVPALASPTPLRGLEPIAIPPRRWLLSPSSGSTPPYPMPLPYPRPHP
jgi:hypothetical protein